jgi:hypothetical protein
MGHFVSVTCRGHRCWCGQEATHKVGEEIPPDDPVPARHNLTSYICCGHYRQLMGPAVACPVFPPTCPDCSDTGFVMNPPYVEYCRCQMGTEKLNRKYEALV